MDKILRERCERAFAKIMNVDPSSVQPDDSPTNIEDWDSLSHVQLLSELESEFGIQINPEEGVGFESFGQMCELVASKML